ncbi:MAG TPA: prephenate dehydrogenase [Methanobacterium sp.]|nr:prephenate dehydrogenase [Methanobacterium sp.]
MSSQDTHKDSIQGDISLKIAVIGGTRGLGRWIAAFLSGKDLKVVVTGRDSITGESVSKKLGVEYSQDNLEAASDADVVVISLPIDVTTDIIKEIGPHMKSGSLLLDVTSVKEGPSRVMHEYAAEGVEVLPCHPMFGPRIRSLDGQVVVLTPVKTGKWYYKILKFLESENARVIVTTPEVHDRMMSIVQGLTHFAYISIAATIEKLDIDVKESRKFASPIYNLMLDTIARITAQNPYLVYSIQTKNSYIEETHKTFLETFSDLKNMISDKNQENFVKSMSSAAKHLDDLESALGRSDKAISALTEEVRILKNLMGREVGLRHIYSGKIHIGILDELSPDFVTIKQNNSIIRLKLSNVEILTADELLKWKIVNYPQRIYDISGIFPKGCDAEVISDTIKNLRGVVDAEVIDTYSGSQIPSRSTSVTIRYKVLEEGTALSVEKLLKGFGSEIR